LQELENKSQQKRQKNHNHLTPVLLEQEGKAQFIIATHSPILMAYPNAMIYSFDNDRIKQVEYEETDHYQLTKAFLNNREKFFRNLFYNS
jgi:predicted ATPase